MRWLDLKVHVSEHVRDGCLDFFQGFSGVYFNLYVKVYFFHFSSTFLRAFSAMFLAMSDVSSFTIVYSAKAIVLPSPTLNSRMSLWWKTSQPFESSLLRLR